MNLYEIDAQIMSLVDEETGEILDTDRLDELAMTRDAKIENIACWIKNLNAEAEALKAEKMAFADRQKKAENKAASLKKYLSDYLAGQKFESAKAKISFRKSESLEITDISKIPDEYLKITKSANKDDIKTAMKCGAVIEGAVLVQNNNISIK